MTVKRRILVDNATLSGVERLLGESKTLNLNNTENDILCLEKLITAILFSDQVISLDDYKEAYRSKRLKRFGFVDFLSVDPEVHARLSEDAAKFAQSMAFSFDGSKPAGDVIGFFEALRLDPQLRWDVFVSSEYLTMSLLVRDTSNVRHETSMDSVFRNELSNANSVRDGVAFQTPVTVNGRTDIANIKDLVQAFKSDNSNYSGTATWSVLDRMVFGYGWVAERSHYYNAVAEREGADAFLAPLRDAFCESCSRIESKSQTESLFDALKSRSQETLAKIVDTSGRAKFALKLPFFTAYFISICESPRQCIELALQARDNSDFRVSRDILSNLHHLTGQDKYGEVNRILGLLEQQCGTLLRKYGVSTQNEVPFSLSLGLSGISLSADLKLNRLFAPYRNKPFARIFRNIAQDMLNVERLGGLYEKLCSTMKEHEEATYLRVATAPKFMENKDNEYGRPAEL